MKTTRYTLKNGNTAFDLARIEAGHDYSGFGFTPGDLKALNDANIKVWGGNIVGSNTSILVSDDVVTNVLMRQPEAAF